MFFPHLKKKHILAEKKSCGQNRRCRSASAGPVCSMCVRWPEGFLEKVYLLAKNKPGILEVEKRFMVQGHVFVSCKLVMFF